MLEDIRFALRLLTKNPSFTLIATATLAVGIGANTAIFSVVNSTLLNAVPYDAPDRLVMVWSSSRQIVQQATVSPANFLDWREQNIAFEHLAASRHWVFNLTGEGSPERIGGAITTPSLFPLLGMKPVLGRALEPQDERSAGNRVAVLGYGLWQRRFGADPAVIGRKLILDGESFTVVGVMPEEFRYPEDVDLWASPKNVVPDFPLNPALDAMPLRGHGYMQVIGRMRPGVTLEQALAEMNSIAARLEEKFPDTNSNSTVNLVPLSEHLFGSVRPALLILLAAVGFVLAVACANVANLMFARASSRQKEMAIRVALGASRGRIVRQLLTESLLLSLMGGSAGVLLAVWGIGPLVALGPGNIRDVDIAIDGRVMAFTLILSLATGILFGVLPALKSSRPDLNESLKESGRASTAGATRRRTGNLLVVSEVALSLLLLVGAGLMIRSLIRLHSIDPGFDPEDTLVISLSQPGSPDVARQSVFVEQVMERIGSLPQVLHVGAISRLPMTGGNSSRDFTIEGRPTLAGEPEANYRVVSPGYFDTMSIPLLTGRGFAGEDRVGAPRAIVINQSFARRFFPDEDPVGKRMTLRITDNTDARGEIVGVVGDVRHFSPALEPQPEMYVSFFQYSWPSLTLVVRSSSDPSSLAAAIRNEVWAIDKDQPLSRTRTMNELISSTISNRRFAMLLLSVFAGVALVLAAVGIFGVISYTVSQRTQEIGLRVALGADRMAILKLIGLQSLTPILVGVCFGIASSLVLTRFLSTLLFGVKGSDPLTFVGASGILMAAALTACLIPAVRAMRVDPMIALRCE